MTDLTNILTVEEAAKWLGIGTAAVYLAIKKKRLDSISIFGRTVIHKEAVIAYNRTRRPRKRKAA